MKVWKKKEKKQLDPSVRAVYILFMMVVKYGMCVCVLKKHEISVDYVGKSTTGEMPVCRDNLGWTECI
jgi:hypothetical protein